MIKIDPWHVFKKITCFMAAEFHQHNPNNAKTENFQVYTILGSFLYNFYATSLHKKVSRLNND